MTKSFVSWVPNITGLLSFSTIGLSRKPRKEHKAYVVNEQRTPDEVRFYFAVERRVTADGLFWPQLADALFGQSGILYFLFVGTSTPEKSFNRILGNIYIVIPQVYQLMKSTLDSLSIISEDGNANFSEDASEIERFLTSLNEDDGVVESSFELWRDGRFRVEIQDNRYSEDPKIIASQIYFFVRDLCHVHQHHEPNSDTIVDVIPGTEFDHSWKREVLYSLYRWIIHRKRERIAIQYNRALGILAYAKSFSRCHISEQELKEKIVPTYQEDSISLSLSAGRMEKMKLEEQQRYFHGSMMKAIAVWVSALIAFSALFVALHRPIQPNALLFRGTGNIDCILRESFDQASQPDIFANMICAAFLYPLGSMIAFFVLLLFFFVAMPFIVKSRRLEIGPLSLNVYQYLRLTSSIGYPKAMFLMILVLVVFFLISSFLLVSKSIDVFVNAL